MLIDRLIGYGTVGPDAYLTIGGRKAWRDLAAVRHPEDPVGDASGTGLGRRLLFQRVPEGKPGEPRTGLHLDLMPTQRSRDEEVERLVASGRPWSPTIASRMAPAG